MISERNIRLLSALPRFRANAPNDAIALERAALELVPESKSMTRDQLYQVVHEALLELSTQKLRNASRNGTPVRATAIGNAPLGATNTTRQRLDVGGYDGSTKFAKLMSYARSLNPTMTHDALFTLACNLN